MRRGKIIGQTQHDTLLPGAEDAQLAESDVEGRGRESNLAMFVDMAYDDHINRAGQGCGVDSGVWQARVSSGGAPMTAAYNSCRPWKGTA